jgi:hypothetical protein
MFHPIAMKKFSASFALAAMFLQSTAFAWVGGPYSNNTTDGIDGGIFQYTIRGSRTSGMSRFSQNLSSSYNSEFGDSVIYFRGTTYYGESYGFVDFASKKVDGIINASASGADNNPQSLWRSATGTTWGVFNGVRYGIGNPLFGGVFDGTSPSSKRSVVNASWRGKLTKTRPVPRFNGKGEASFLGEGNSTTTTTITSATGDFDTPTPPALPVDPPTNGSITTTVVNRGDGGKLESRVRIRVYGGRISVAPYLGTNAFRAL